MKILDLKLKAFGPFLEEVHIDFTKLNESGMYLINGPTGTGKTTLFDAIMFALYGEASGNDRKDSKGLRSDFAKITDETYVELLFESGGETYKVRRAPGYTRKSKRGDGETDVSEKVELLLPNGEVLNKNKEVNNKIIQDILYISRAQFKSVALLAQGEFTDLITASSADRAAMLEHIFDKALYNDFQAKINEISEKAKEESKLKTERVNTLINSVDGAEEFLSYQTALVDPSNIPSFLSDLQYAIKTNQNILQAKNDEKEKADASYQELNKKLIELQGNNERIRAYLLAKNKLEELSKNKESIKAKEKEKEIQAEFNEIYPFWKNLDDREKEQKEHNIGLEDCKKKQILLLDDKKWLDDNKQAYENNLKELGNIKIMINTLIDIDKQRKTLINDKKIVDNLEKDFINSYKTLETKLQHLNNVREAYSCSISYNLAKELQDNKPCPVCGSLSHPHPAISDNYVSEDDYKAADKDYKDFDKTHDALNNKYTEAKAALKAKETGFIQTLKNAGFVSVDNDFIYTDGISKAIVEQQDNEKKTQGEITIYENKNKTYDNASVILATRIDSLTKALESDGQRISKAEDDLNGCFKDKKHISSLDQFDSYQRENKRIDINAYDKQIMTYRNEVLRNQTIVDETPEQLRNAGEVDISELVEKHKEAKYNLDAITSEANSLGHKIDSLKKSSVAIENAYKECKEVIHRYTSLSELAKYSNGANKKKLSFKMYILTDYFDKILLQANRRLHIITNGRYKLVRREEAKGNSLQQGLDLNVFDLETGKERMASTLSGGEKFVSALSLALGLSDIIESNHAKVQIDSIFIDEGFGTLDDNFIDTAMKALETLKGANKTVAIISHVAKLKDYVTERLEVEKASIGSKVVHKSNI